MSNQVPIIDVGPWLTGDSAARRSVAQKVDDACTEWGFLIISGHGMNPALMSDIHSVTRDFFDLPVEEKLKASGSNGLGYSGFKKKAVGRTYGNDDNPPDLREGFTFRTGVRRDVADRLTSASSATGVFGENPWPAQPAAMRQLWLDYLDACNKLNIELMRLCAAALSLPENWFDKKVDRPMSSLIAAHYPELDEPPEPGQVRSAPHTDFGTLTLLMTEDKPGGLQVNIDGTWHDVKPIPGTYIVNLGDMMAQWTNDRWRSTLHRVVNPPLDMGRASRRLSMVYFGSPNYDALIECIPSCTDAQHPKKYQPVLAGEHLLGKVQKGQNIPKAS